MKSKFTKYYGINLIIIFLINTQFLLSELPADFPKIRIDSIAHPYPGYTFLNSINFGGKTVNYNFIIDSLGGVFKYHKPLTSAVDFKIQPNGLFSYGTPVKLGSKYQAGPVTVQNVMVVENIVDSSFKLIDQVQMQNGYLADIHEFVMLPNGHYLMMAYESNPVDMSKLLPDGDPNAVVVGTVIQELDKNKNCIFQWRSTDFIPILETFDDPTHKTFEHVHGNSLFLDTDGNVIASFATTNEIIKIDMVSGNIMWRLGGRKNQFKFINEHPENSQMYISMTHDAKKLPNGNLLFYDNGVMKKTWYSRAVEYVLDENKKEATLAWEYRHQPDISAFAMGSVQRLPNGNTLINWGLIFKGLFRTLTEVNSKNEIEFEMSIPSDAFSYRAFKYDLPACLPVADIDKYEILKGNTYSFKNAYANSGVQIYFKELDGFIYNLVNLKKYECAPMNPIFDGETPVILPLRYVVSQNEFKSFAGEIKFELSFLPKLMLQSQMKVYFRPNEGAGTFIKLESKVDDNGKYLVGKCNEFGEYIIGFERTSNEINAPTLLYPFNQKSFVNNTPVFLNWSSTGRYDSFNLQISTEDTFSSLELDSNNLLDTRLLVNFDNDTKYYWRVRTKIKDKLSSWSEVREFSLKEPYLKLLNPIGGEVYTKDSNYVLRWETNLPDSVKITLLKDDQPLTLLSDSLYSYHNGFLWLVPTNVPDGNFYKIRLESITDKSLAVESNKPFTIKSFVGVDEVNSSFYITHYPNPAKHTITFDFQLNTYGITSIELFDILGNKIRQLYTDFLTPGKYKVNSSIEGIGDGLYWYKISSGNVTHINKIIIMQ
jgi:hypothetical protein